MQTSSTLNFFLLSFICTSWASNFDIINMLSCFHAIPAVQFNTRECLLGCKRTIVDNSTCRHALNRPWKASRENARVLSFDCIDLISHRAVTPRIVATRSRCKSITFIGSYLTLPSIPSRDSWTPETWVSDTEMDAFDTRDLSYLLALRRQTLSHLSTSTRLTSKNTS